MALLRFTIVVEVTATSIASVFCTEAVVSGGGAVASANAFGLESVNVGAQ